MKITYDYSAIDPMAVILPEDIYYIWCLIHHPHTPPAGEIRDVIDRLNPDQKKMLGERIQMITKYGQSLIDSAKNIEAVLKAKAKTPVTA